MVVKNCDLQKIMDSGQCFRIYAVNDHYEIYSGDNIALGTQIGSDAKIAPICGDDKFWEDYFDADTDYEALCEYFLTVYDVPFIRKSIEFSKGLRLLNQNPDETLISFIISQRKNIPAIRKCIEDVCSLWGRKNEGYRNSFPSIETLLGSCLEDVKGFGYRLPYIRDAVVRLNRDKMWLTCLRDCSYDGAKNSLKSIYGVGDKVADCTLLYGLGFRNSFPIDVWINRVITDDLNGYMPIDKFEHDIGVLQLWMFYYKRLGGI